VPGNLIYEVECTLDPDIVADYDAWLPGHVRDVLACAGFLGATIESPETPAGDRAKRKIRYRVESAAALDHYLENSATKLRTETAERYGGRVHCERRTLRPRHDLTPPAHDARRCLNCGSPLTGNHCVECGQSSDVHVLSMKEVAGDVTHSLLHLDSRVWRTLKLLIFRPGDLTREFIAGRHQSYLPPFRLYLGISILFFALSALLPDSEVFDMDHGGEAVVAPVTLETPGGTKAVGGGTACEIKIFDSAAFADFELALERACRKMRADGGANFAERFASTAPKLMFLFLPLMAAFALLFYWRPRRLYAEHLVLFLHNHAFTFLLIAVTEIFSTIADLKIPYIGILGFVTFLLFVYLPYYVFRSMRVVYGEGRFKTTLKFLALGTIYFLLLGITMLAGLVYAMLTLA
jgi:hypothetical protein